MHETLKAAIGEISRFPLFHEIAESEIRNLCEDGQIKVHSHKQVVFEFGQPAIYFGVVLSGAYKLSRISPVGEESVIHFCCPGDVIAALVMPQPNGLYPVTVKAMGPSRLLILSRETYLKHWIKNPQLIIKIQSLLSTRMTRLQHQKVMQRAPMASKIASLLMQLVATESNLSSELEVPLPLTRKEIADTLGVTVESVIRVMSEWVKQGYIATTDQHIKILKPELLIEQIDQAE